MYKRQCFHCTYDDRVDRRNNMMSLLTPVSASMYTIVLQDQDNTTLFKFLSIFGWNFHTSSQIIRFQRVSVVFPFMFSAVTGFKKSLIEIYLPSEMFFVIKIHNYSIFLGSLSISSLIILYCNLIHSIGVNVQHFRSIFILSPYCPRLYIVLLSYKLESCT